MAEYLTVEFGQKGSFDRAAIDIVRQRCRARWTWLDRPPTDAELRAAIRKVGDGKSAGDAQLSASGVLQGFGGA